MKESEFENKITLIRSIVGAVLALASLPFLWKGVVSTGEIGLDFQFFSGKFSTTSAGFALLFAGVILLIPRYYSRAENLKEKLSLGQLTLAVVFYIFIGLLPLIFWAGLMLYLYYSFPESYKSASPGLMFVVMVEVPLIVWVVERVSRLFHDESKKDKSDQKKVSTT